MRDIRVVTNAFFDSKRVLRAVSVAERKTLSRAGAFVRRRAQSSIGNKVKRTTTPRPPGSPPRNRTGKLKRSIYFAYDFTTRSVWVGPILFPRGQGRGAMLLTRTVPESLEFGGGKRPKSTGPKTTPKQYGYAKHGLNLAHITRDMQRKDVGGEIGAALRGEPITVRSKSATINAHPFMNPALQAEAEAGTLLDPWRNAVMG